MKIEQKEIEKVRRRVVKPAGLEHVPTGEMREQVVHKQDGTRETRLIPITNAVQVDAVISEEKYKETVYVIQDGPDEHVFANETDAKRFLESAVR